VQFQARASEPHRTQTHRALTRTALTRMHTHNARGAFPTLFASSSQWGRERFQEVPPDGGEWRSRGLLRVKFGAFIDHLESRHGADFERIASGHYARVLRGGAPGAPARLAVTADAVKDQTYFLAHLSQRQLSRLMFPLSPLTKPAVRRLASAARLPNKARKDSQGICFLGKVRAPRG
jgi:tRNA methyl transferase